MTAFNGIIFFSDDVLNKKYGGSFTASSNSANAEKAFDGDLENGWQSSSENSDSTTSYVRRVFETPVSGDTVVVTNHNLKNLNCLQINDNQTIFPGYCKTEKNCTVLKLGSVYTNISSIKIFGSETVVANSEKQIGNILLLTQIGQLQQPQEVSSKLNFEQSELSLQGGKKFIFDSGKFWEFEMSIFSLSQSDIDLLNNIRNLRKNFYIWLCGGDTEQFSYNFEPYQFNNFIKVSVKGGVSPNLKDNLYWTGLRDKLKLVEVE